MAVRYERFGSVTVVTIDRPERRNAIDRATAQGLYRAWRDFDADSAARVGILTGAGGVFCAGADLVAFDLEETVEGWLGICRLAVSKPTIAAVAGPCVAGGLELALWCDLRVAATDAVFGCFERRFGVPLADGGTQRLPHIVGLSRALDMILTGRPVPAEEAFRIGLADRLVPPGEELAEARRLAEAIASFPQDTMRSDRKALFAGLGRPLREGLAVEAELGRQVVATAIAGAARFASGEGRSGAEILPA
ncbi:MAG: crotonase/enoyl-CoA hydratase family protein [Acidimicrobiia bacterium]|nr:crotonase/enoyl-CoA hydratase family protein [Acidimicrobiia bacterium]